MVLEKFKGLTKRDKEVIRFVNKTSKTPGADLRRMEQGTKEMAKSKECMLCIRIDRVNPNVIHLCDTCLNKIARRYAVVKMGSAIIVQSRKPYVPYKECEHCHTKSMWHSQVAIKLCDKCNARVNKKIVEATVWKPFNPSLTKPSNMSIPRISSNVPMWKHHHRAW